MDDRDVMRTHIEALFTHDARGDLVRVNEPNGGAAPRFFLGRTMQGDVWRFRHDVTSDMRAELEAAIRDDKRRGIAVDSPIDSAPYQEILARSAPVERTEVGPAYMDADGQNVTRLTDSPSQDRSPTWSPDGLRIAFTSDRDGDDEVYIMNADGTGPVRLTTSAAPDVLDAWQR